MPPRIPPEVPEEPPPIIIPDIEEDDVPAPQQDPDIPPIPPNMPEQPWIDPPAINKERT